MESILQGWLIKSPPEKKAHGPWKIFGAKWRKRYFVLYAPPTVTGIPDAYSAILEYYSTKKLHNKCGTINLADCDEVLANLDSDTYKHVFGLHTKDKSQDRTYYLVADTEVEMNKWVNRLCQVLGLAENDDLPSCSPDGRHRKHHPGRPLTQGARPQQNFYNPPAINPLSPDARATTIGMPFSRLNISEPNLLEACSPPERKFGYGDDDLQKRMRNAESVPELDRLTSPRKLETPRERMELPPIPPEKTNRQNLPPPPPPSEGGLMDYDHPKQKYYERRSDGKRIDEQLIDFPYDPNTPPEKPSKERKRAKSIDPNLKVEENYSSSNRDEPTLPLKNADKEKFKAKTSCVFSDDELYNAPKSMNKESEGENKDCYNVPKTSCVSRKEDGEECYDVPSKAEEEDCYNVPKRSVESDECYGVPSENKEMEDFYNVPPKSEVIDEYYDAPSKLTVTEDFYNVPNLGKLDCDSHGIRQSRSSDSSSHSKVFVAQDDDFYNVPKSDLRAINSSHHVPQLGDKNPNKKSLVNSNTARESEFASDETYDSPKRVKEAASHHSKIEVVHDNTKVSMHYEQDETYDMPKKDSKAGLNATSTEPVCLPAGHGGVDFKPVPKKRSTVCSHVDSHDASSKAVEKSQSTTVGTDAPVEKPDHVPAIRQLSVKPKVPNKPLSLRRSNAETFKRPAAKADTLESKADANIVKPIHDSKIAPQSTTGVETHSLPVTSQPVREMTPELKKKSSTFNKNKPAISSMNSSFQKKTAPTIIYNESIRFTQRSKSFKRSLPSQDRSRLPLPIKRVNHAESSSSGSDDDDDTDGNLSSGSTSKNH